MPDEHVQHGSSQHGHESASGAGGMGMRGVTRPMAEQAARKHHEEMQQSHEAGDYGVHAMDHHAMSHDDRLMMLRMHHKQTLWVYWTLPLLGV